MKFKSIRTEFGKAVRLRRKQLKLSQGELAGRTSLHRTYISDVERGKRNLSLRSIAQLSEALKVPITTFFKCQPKTPAGLTVKAHQGSRPRGGE